VFSDVRSAENRKVRWSRCGCNRVPSGCVGDILISTLKFRFSPVLTHEIGECRMDQCDNYLSRISRDNDITSRMICHKMERTRRRALHGDVFFVQLALLVPSLSRAKKNVHSASVKAQREISMRELRSFQRQICFAWLGTTLPRVLKQHSLEMD